MQARIASIVLVLATAFPAAAEDWSVGGGASAVTSHGKYLGRFNANRFDPESIANPFGRYGASSSPDSINNPAAPAARGRDGRGPKIIAPDGTYLGRLNLNSSDPESVANPSSPYGSPRAPNSINNLFGRYGSRFSPDGIRNPDTTGGPMLFDDN
jgi:hypothetical protein